MEGNAPRKTSSLFRQVSIAFDYRVLLEVVLKSLSMRHPESVLATMNLSTDEFEREAKFLLAVKLFELGRLTEAGEC